jgi:hypothetical protein
MAFLVPCVVMGALASLRVALLLSSGFCHSIANPLLPLSRESTCLRALSAKRHVRKRGETRRHIYIYSSGALGALYRCLRAVSAGYIVEKRYNVIIL